MQNKRKTIFLYVGHANFGKSRTLKCLTRDISQVKTTKISGENFKVRKMSNNDDVLSYLAFIRKLEESFNQYFISAFSPDEDKEANHLLAKLAQIADLHIFVQLEGHIKGQISEKELKNLRMYDDSMFILTEKLEADERAVRFLDFIKENLKN